MAREVLVTGLAVDWEQVEREFAERRLSTVLGLVTRAGLTVSFLEDAFDGAWQREVPLGSCFDQLWAQSASGSPGTTRLVGFYVYARAQVAWELTAKHEPIAATLTAAWSSWSSGGLRVPDAEHRDVSLTLRHALSLLPAMQAENALNCSCPDQLAAFAGLVERESAGLLAELAEDAVRTPFGRMLRGLLESHERYYRGVHAAARAMASALDDAPGAGAELQQAVREVASLEEALGDDVYASELRPHRKVLEVMQGRLEHGSTPSVRLHDLRLVYVYPFHLALGRPVTDRLSDTRMVGSAVVRDLQLSDVWKVDRVSSSEEAGDAGLGGERLTGVYDGKVLVVGRLRLGEDAGRLAGDYEVEIHLNDPGNHYVRISSALLHDATLHELNQGIRRGSVHMGSEQMSAPLVSGAMAMPSGRGTVAAYVEALVDSLAPALQHAMADDTGHPLREARCVIDVERDGHVVVEIQSALVDGRPTTPEALLAHAGRLLWQPIQNYATALEEWMLLPPATDEPTNILGFAGQRDELGVSSNHVTMLFSPHAPSWRLHGYKELVEFCVTLPCLLRSWIRQLDEQVKALRHEGSRTDRDPTIAELEDLETRLHDKRLHFAGQALDVRIVRERLERVAAAANRALMRNMLEAVHVGAYDRALAARLELHELASSTVAQRTRSIREKLEAEARRTDEHYQDRVRSLLNAITILGLAGFLSYLNSLFTDSPPAWIWAAVELPLLVALSVLLWWHIQRRDVRPQRGGRHRPRHPGQRGAI